jgi:transposase-like protein
MERVKRICPRCKRTYLDYPAISRRDNKTPICPDCGTAEAFEDYFGDTYTGEKYWEEDES